MKNSICMLSFPISHIVFFFKKKMYVVLISLGVCFFTKRVRVLVKDFKDFNVFCLTETSMSSVFTFSKTSMSFVLQRLQCLLSLCFKTSMSYLHLKDFNVFCLTETSMSSVFTFQAFKVFCLVLLILRTFILLTGFTASVLASCRSDSKIARMKLVSLSLLTFSFSIKDK